MGYKVFVSYKYADKDVYNSFTNFILLRSLNYTVRDYVDILETIYLSPPNNHIYKGESNDEDLSGLTDETIWDKLKDRIYDSSVTIVLISPNMKTENILEKEQWIPWEISYSLKEITRNDRTSHRNAMLAVVLPGKNNSYEYCYKKRQCLFFCHNNNCYYSERKYFFNIIGDNLLNLKDITPIICPFGERYFENHFSSYIKLVKWEDFI
jgi:hypothetical protein